MKHKLVGVFILLTFIILFWNYMPWNIIKAYGMADDYMSGKYDFEVQRVEYFSPLFEGRYQCIGYRRMDEDHEAIVVRIYGNRIDDDYTENEFMEKYEPYYSEMISDYFGEDTKYRIGFYQSNYAIEEDAEWIENNSKYKIDCFTEINDLDELRDKTINFMNRVIEDKCRPKEIRVSNDKIVYYIEEINEHKIPLNISDIKVYNK